jgi:hypothetical protein
MQTTNNEHDAYNTWGGVLTVKWHDGENAMPGRREGQENEPEQEGGGEGEPQYCSTNKRDN